MLKILCVCSVILMSAAIVVISIAARGNALSGMSAQNNSVEKFDCETTDGWLIRNFDGSKVDGASLSIVNKAIAFHYRRARISPLFHTALLTGLREIQLRMRSEAAVTLMFGVQDNDGATFNQVASIPAGKWTTVRIAASDFKLNDDSPVKKSALDPQRLGAGYVFLDLSAVARTKGENTITIDGVTIERASAASESRDSATKRPAPTIMPPKAGGRNSDDDEELTLSALPKSRSFYMGFTPGEYDLTAEAVEWTYKFLEENADLVAHHLDEGIPWPEAFEKRPYHPNVESALNARVQRLNRRQKTYLAITPVRDGLATYWAKDAQMERPGRWKDKEIDDAEAITAYLNFSRDLIRRFRPDFMAYGIEVNLHLAKNNAQWSRFVNLAREVYTTLKAENPNLPLFLTLQIDEFWKDEKNQTEAIRQILPYTDFVAVSTYPYFYGYFDPSTIPEGYFSKVAALAPEKPFVVAETGFTAEDLDALGKKGPGSVKWQNAYMKLLLKESDRLNAKFVMWFVPRDYDAVIERLKSFGASRDVIELFKVWKDNGVVDEAGNRRKAYVTWNRWLNLPVSHR